MPLTLPEDPGYTEDEVVMPVAGEPVRATAALQGTIHTSLQKLTARTALAYRALRGARHKLQLSCQDGETILLRGLDGVLAEKGGIWCAGNDGAGSQNLTDADMEGGAPFPDSSWCYVYAEIANDFTLNFVITTTGPDAKRQWEDGEETRAYLGCFRTKAAGVVLNFQSVNGRYAYASPTSDDNRMLNNGTATMFTNVPCTDRIPPHVWLGTFQLMLENDDDSEHALMEVAADHADITEGVTLFCGWAPTGGLARANMVLDLPVSQTTATLQDVKYRVEGAGAEAHIWVAGFLEP